LCAPEYYNIPMEKWISAVNTTFTDPVIAIGIMLALLVFAAVLFILSAADTRRKFKKQLNQKEEEKKKIEEDLGRAEKDSEMYAKIVNESGAAVYVCNDSTFELIYMSDYMHELFPDASGSYEGKKCYEFLMGRYTPCPFCRLPLLKEDSLTARECCDEGKKTCYHFNGKRISWDGTPAIINYVRDDTAAYRARQRMEENYHNQITLMSDVSPQAVGTYRINLTRNTFMENFGASSEDFDVRKIRTADELFEFAYEHCATRGDEEELSAVFERGRLLQSFSEGVTKLSVDHGYYMKADKPTWITSAISMAQNPSSGDVEAIIYTVDIRKEKIMESMLKTVADSDYDFISLVDLTDGSYQEAFGKHMPGLLHDNFKRSYADAVEKNIRENGADVDVEEVIEKLSLDRVREELAAKRRYNVYYMEYDRSGNRRNKLISFMYIDRTGSLVCVMGSDVTEEYENDRRARLKYDAALEASRRLANAPMQILTSTGDYHFEGKKILLVEDHPLNYRIAENLLTKVGCTVFGAANGQEALDTFLKNPSAFDLILMDIRMPVMDGFTAVQKIRTSGGTGAGQIPIIAMTANAFEEDINKSKAAGMNSHLAKPIDPQKLYETLSEYLK
jgi:CheY-like chemotaxis protein